MHTCHLISPRAQGKQARRRSMLVARNHNKLRFDSTRCSASPRQPRHPTPFVKLNPEGICHACWGGPDRHCAWDVEAPGEQVLYCTVLYCMSDPCNRRPACAQPASTRQSTSRTHGAGTPPHTQPRAMLTPIHPPPKITTKKTKRQTQHT